MIRRLTTIALLTGAAHVFTVVALKLLSRQISSERISLIGQIDSLFQLIINLLAFGLQLSAVRHIAASDNWKEVYRQTQVARTTFAMLLLPFAALSFSGGPYQYFLLAPIFALSGDYALYGTGRPVVAAIMAFIRVFVPSLALVVFSFLLTDYLVAAYVVSTVLVFWVTSLLIAKWIGSPFWFRPKFKSLWLYFESLSLGIVTLSSYIIGLGLIVVATNFYNSAVVAVAYFGLKLYMIFKGVLRIINQAFIKEMLHDEVCLRVDQIASLAGLTFAGALILFPEGFTSMFLDKQYQGNSAFLITIGVAGMIAAIFTSFTTRSLLKNKDKPYAVYAAVAAGVSIFSVIVLSFFYQTPLSIGVSLLIGELLMAISLIAINKDALIKNRFRFLTMFVGLLAIPAAVRIVAGDNVMGLITGISLFVLAGGTLFYKRSLVVSSSNSTSI